MTKAYQNFIPTLWSARLLANLDKKFVYPMCVNRDYEGEIKNLGDTVKINQIGDVTVGDYTGSVGEAEELTSTQTTLTIDQAKYFHFKVEDIEATQANVNLVDEAMRRASVKISNEIDQYIASFVKDAKITVGSASTPVALTTPAQAYDQLVDLKVLLNSKNVPQEGRFVVVPPEFVGLLEKDDRFTKNYDKDVLANGVVGKVAGFDVRESNNVPVKSGVYNILAGTSMAISYAGQIAKVKTYEPEDGFATAVKGLYVFGAKTVLPDAICNLTAKFTA